MAVTIRCSECHKKISVDAAFAGSMCRCPYCKSIVLVPKAVSAVGARQPHAGRPTAPQTGTRPAAPSPTVDGGQMGSRPIIQLVEEEIDKSRLERESRIKSPLVVDDISHGLIGVGKDLSAGQQQEKAVPEVTKPFQKEEVVQDIAADIVLEAPKVDSSKLSAEQLAQIPTANPIMFQGVVSLILIFVLVVMIGACVFLGYRMFATNEQRKADDINSIYDSPEIAKELEQETPDVNPNPFVAKTDAAAVCGNIPVKSPVVYCIDGGASMGGNMYPLAKDMVRASIIGMPADAKFAVLVGQEDKVNNITGGLISAGASGEEAIREKILETEDEGLVTVGGQSDLDDLISRAADIKPGTIVLLLNQKNISAPSRLAKLAAKSGAELVVIMLTASPDQEKTAQEMIKLAGKGKLRVYTLRDMEKFYEESDLP